jgi:hypothetical protein
VIWCDVVSRNGDCSMSSCVAVASLDSEPVVGHTYLVRVVEYGGLSAPVLGDAHDDRAALGIYRHHFHYDLRFVSDALASEIWRRMKLKEPATFDQVDFNIQLLFFATIGVPRFARKSGHLEPMPCVRTMPRFPDWAYAVHTSKVEWYVNRHRLTLARDSRGCTRCPHRGTCLSGLPASKEGVVTCPSHGVSWNRDGTIARGYITRAAGLPPRLETPELSLRPALPKP